jgi:predicted DNA-binding transcriptional regulator AlpA
MKAEKEGCISAGKLAKELSVHPRTIARRAVALGIIKPMQKWVFTKKEANLIRKKPRKKKVTLSIEQKERRGLVKNDEVCNLLQISKATLWEWRRKYPDFPVYKMENTVRFDLNEVVEWYNG